MSVRSEVHLHGLLGLELQRLLWAGADVHWCDSFLGLPDLEEQKEMLNRTKRLQQRCSLQGLEADVGGDWWAVHHQG